MSEASLESFRSELIDWLETSCPKSLRPGAEASQQDREAWQNAFIGRGYTSPTWPTEYGGGGLSKAEARVLAQEVPRFASWVPVASFFGTSMLGPVLLEFGNEEQKQEHLRKITSCEIQWCQGYSEPGAGSDLASLQTRGVSSSA
jgi:alkylation response protein AidB-like acyl-CoA dehydrogenase